jgi:DNA-binding response OmpR family regulator
MNSRLPRIDGVLPWTALIVEDEALIAASIEAILTELGASEVGWATTVDEAERALATATPTIAVADWWVGRRTSETLVRRFAAARIGILVLTGASPEEIVRPSDAEILVLAKPAGDASIAEAVRRLLRGRPVEACPIVVTGRESRSE